MNGCRSGYTCPQYNYYIVGWIGLLVVWDCVKLLYADRGLRDKGKDIGVQ